VTKEVEEIERNKEQETRIPPPQRKEEEAQREEVQCVQKGDEKKDDGDDDEEEEARERAAFASFKFPANEEMTKLVEVLRKEIADLMEIGTTLHAWVKLSIPGRGSEERPFEAAVQEEMAQEMTVVKASGTILIHSILAFLLRRALLVEEVGKHQDVQDYRLAVPQMDMEQLVSVKRWIRDCRNMYQLILDLVAKNLSDMTQREKEKIDGDAKKKKGEDDAGEERSGEEAEDEAIIRKFQQRVRRTPTRRIYRTTSRDHLL